MKKRVPLILLGVIVILLIGYFIAKPKRQSIYFKPLSDVLETLDPQKTRSRAEYMIGRAIYGQLLQLNEFGNVKPALIESWKVEEKGALYLLKIREDVRFHNGKKATLEDIVFSIHYLAQPDSLVSHFFQNVEGYDSYAKGAADTISGIRAVGPSSLELRLNVPSYVFLSTFADPKIVVLPKDLLGKSREEFFTRPIGIGPFKFDSHKDGILKLNRNVEYFKGAPKISTLVFEKMDKPTAIQRLRAGEVHDLENFQLTQEEVEEIGGVANVYSTSSLSTGLLFFNSKVSLFKDEKTRRAFRWSFDIEAISKTCNVRIIPSTGIFPHGLMGWIEERTVSDDLRATYAKHGKRLGRALPELKFLTYGNEYPSCLYKGLIENIGRITGAKVKHLHVNLNEAVKIFSTGGYDLFFEHLTVRGREPFHILSYFDPASAHNLTTFKDKKITEMVHRIPSISIRNQRALEYAKLNDYIANEAMLVSPLFTDIRQYAFQKSVRSHSVPATIQGSLGFDEIWLD